MPVHKWLVRHLYNPMLKRGFSYNIAVMTTFFVFGAMHEYVISLSLQVWTLLAFSGIFFQAPVILIQKKVQKMMKN